MIYEPYPYQERAADFLAERDHRAILALRMGLGKTVITATALGDLLDTITARRILIVGPPRVVRSVWPAEFEKWRHLRDWDRPLALAGRPQHLRNRTRTDPATGAEITQEVYAPGWLREARNPSTAIHLASYDQLPTKTVTRRPREEGGPYVERVYLGLVDLLAAAWPYDTLVLDEIHNAKSPGSQRFRALRRVLGKCERVIGLTGTPVPNNLLDIWAPLYAVDLGERLGTTHTAFKRRWFRPAFSGFGVEPLPTARGEIETRIGDVCLGMKSEDYLKLPPRIDNHIRVELPRPARRMYERLTEEMYLALAEGEVSPANAAVLTAKCEQAANGAVYLDGKGGEFKVIHEAKLDALEEILENGEPVLCAVLLRSDWLRIKARFKHARRLDESPTIETEWNAGRVPLLVLQAAQGEGLNLQLGGRTIVWFAPTWNLLHYEQLNARLHRQGQTRSVMVHHLIAADTVDELKLERLETKAEVQDLLLTAMKGAKTP